MSPTRERIAVEQLRAEAARPFAPRPAARGPRKPKPWTGAYEQRRLRYLRASGRGDTEEAIALRARVAEIRRDGRIQPRTEVV
jgi:hypothetical protein